MQITQLSLQHFRNFAAVESIDFPADALLVAAAPNATGKTNFLEAMVVLLRGKSFRAGLPDCVQWGTDGFLLRGQVTYREGQSELAVRYHAPTKKIRIEENGIPASLITFYNRYPMVLFLPEDTFLFNRGPEQRRNFFNHTLVCLPSYLTGLVQYQRALRQRNAQLKSAQSFTEVAAWTEVLVEHSQAIWQQRQSLVDFLQTHIGDLYQQLTGEVRTFQVQLVPGVSSPEAFTQYLQDSFATEQRFGYTSQGPHRDDLELLVDGRPLTAILSRGQLRSVVIALKLAAHRFITQAIGESPLLLLDEVLSELDEERQHILLQNLPQTQILLTCTTVPATVRQRSNVHLLDLRSITSPEELLPVAEEALAEPA